MSAANEFQALFETVPMVANVKRYVTAAAGRPHTAVYRVGQRVVAPVGGNTVGWKEKRFSRGLARVTGHGSPTKAAKKPKQTPRSATLIDVKEHVDLPPEWLYLMQNPDVVGDNAVDTARANFAEALENISGRIANTVEYVCTKANEGSVDLSTVPNSELTHTITYPTAALASAADWDLAATKIRSSEMRLLKDAYTKAAGIKAGQAIATDLVEQYITQNTEVTSFITEGSMAARMLERSFEEGGAMSLFGGLLWQFSGAHYALDATPNTTVDYQTSDVITILPPQARLGEACCMGEGVELIPRGPKFGAGDASALQALLMAVQGPWAYVELSMNPVVVRLHAGYKFLPIQKIPNAVAAFNSVA